MRDFVFIKSGIRRIRSVRVLGQLLRRCLEIVPGPFFCRIRDLSLVEHVLVIVEDGDLNPLRDAPVFPVRVFVEIEAVIVVLLQVPIDPFGQIL
ncbi:hypothetical protein D3C74_326600 [compost metagenome]